MSEPCTPPPHPPPQITSLTDENQALRTHAAQLQGHMQAMTARVYELTSKCEAVSAENVQLRSELRVQQRALQQHSLMTVKRVRACGPGGCVCLLLPAAACYCLMMARRGGTCAPATA